MTVIAYDSARPSLIPVNAQAVFPYADGHFNYRHTEFPRAAYRYITVQGNPDIDIADFEIGCVWPDTALEQWASERHRLYPDDDVTVYCDRYNFPAAKAAMARAGVTRWHLFLSTLDGTKPQAYGGMQLRAVQFTDRNNAYDMSVVYDTNWLIQP